MFLAGCSETPGLPGGTYTHFQEFKKAPLHRAYAIARATNGYSAAVVGNEASAEAAEAAALARCQSYASQKLFAE